MLEEDGKHSLPALKSGLNDLVSLVVWAQPCFLPTFAGPSGSKRSRATFTRRRFLFIGQLLGYPFFGKLPKVKRFVEIL